MKKKVRHLQQNDILSSGARIINNPYSSVRCPKGKLNVEVEYPNGQKKIQQWNKETIVDVIGRVGVNQKMNA